MRILIHAFSWSRRRRVLFLVIYSLFSYQLLHGQFLKRADLSAGLQVALPRDEFRSFTSFGTGVCLQVESSMSGKVRVVGSTGWMHFFGKDYGAGKTKGTNSIPMILGARYYPFPWLFVGIMTGYTLYFAGASSEGGFTYSPQVGYNVKRWQWVLGYADTRVSDSYQHLSLSCVYKLGSW